MMSTGGAGVKAMKHKHNIFFITCCSHNMWHIFMKHINLTIFLQITVFLLSQYWLYDIFRSCRAHESNHHRDFQNSRQWRQYICFFRTLSLPSDPKTPLYPDLKVKFPFLFVHKLGFGGPEAGFGCPEAVWGARSVSCNTEFKMMFSADRICDFGKKGFEGVA